MRSIRLGSAGAEPPPFEAALGAIRHGTHICAFYETDEDFLGQCQPKLHPGWIAR